MPLYTHQPVWRYAIFQISAGCIVLFLILALLASQLSWLPRLVAVHLTLDLSSSTYETTEVFRGAGTIMAEEIAAVKAYVDRNAGLPQPNAVSISGFADSVVPITRNFTSDPQEIEQAIEDVIQPALSDRIGGSTNINLAIEDGVSQLKTQPRACPEIVAITDGVFELEKSAIQQAQKNNVKLNFLVVGQPINAEIDRWAKQTGGIALEANPNSIAKLLSGKVFNHFNTSPLVPLFYGCAFISFMWMLLLPLERFLELALRIRIDRASQIAVYNAFFWTVITPIFLIVSGLFNPLQSC